MAEHDYATNEKSEQLTEALLSELLRNSQATLAIVKFHGIKLATLKGNDSDLSAKVDDVQDQLAEVEDVLETQAAKVAQVAQVAQVAEAAEADAGVAQAA